MHTFPIILALLGAFVLGYLGGARSIEERLTLLIPPINGMHVCLKGAR